MYHPFRSAQLLDLSSAFFDVARSNIKGQRAIVATLTPGSADHRQATDILLLLQDSLFIMAETRAMIDHVR